MGRGTVHRPRGARAITHCFHRCRARLYPRALRRHTGRICAHRATPPGAADLRHPFVSSSSTMQELQRMATPERDPDCLFCKIIAGEIPGTRLLETDDVIVIQDINPQAPVHGLAIPKRHIPSAAHLTLADAATLAAVIDAANTVARDKGVADSG